MTGYQGPPPPRETNTGLIVAAVVSCLFCLVPGIVGVVFAAQGKDQQAKPWIIVAYALGVLGTIVAVLVN